MEQKASEIQKQRIKEIESAADRLVGKCKIMFVSSVNENGYPRTCCVSKLKDTGFRDLVFVTSKRSEKQGKSKHFEANSKTSIYFQDGEDSLTLVGEVNFITDRAEMQNLWNENDKTFSQKELTIPK